MIHVGDNTWNLRIFITDLQVEKKLRVRGDLHIGGLMLKLVDPGLLFAYYQSLSSSSSLFISNNNSNHIINVYVICFFIFFLFVCPLILFDLLFSPLILSSLSSLSSVFSCILFFSFYLRIFIICNTNNNKTGKSCYNFVHRH